MNILSYLQSTGQIPTGMTPEMLARAEADAAGITPPVGNADILVQANKPQENSVDPRSFGNVTQREELQAAYDNPTERKGMFGVKGTLRDVLGLVGDAFLVQSGNKATYQPYRQGERESDAMAGFTQDNAGASERLGFINAPAGAALYEQGQKQEYNQDRIINAETKLQQELERQKEAVRIAQAELVRKQAADQARIDIEAAKEQGRKERFREPNRPQPRAQPRPQQDTPNSVVGGILKKEASGQRLTTAQQAVLDRHYAPKTSGGRKTQSGVSPRTVTKPGGFRIINTRSKS